jgi:hypothetical protein
LSQVVPPARRDGDGHGCQVSRAGDQFEAVVGEDQAEVGLVGSGVVDLELQSVVKAALEVLGRLGDVDVLEDGQGVDEALVLGGLGPVGVCQVGVGLSGWPVRFEGVETATQPVAEGSIRGVGVLQFSDEPVLPACQVFDLGADRVASGGVGLSLLVGQGGGAAPQVGVAVGAEDAGGDDVVEGGDEASSRRR